MICDFLQDNEKMKKLIKEQEFDLLVTSYGGSCSNAIEGILRKNGLNIRYGKTKEEKHKCIWRKLLCHSPCYVNLGKPIIYIYDNQVVKAFLSVKRRGRGWWDTNQKKLNNNKNVELSDENLLKSMIQQFYSFTNQKRKDVLVIKASEIFQPEIKEKLEKFLGCQLKGLPLKYREPTVNLSSYEYSKEEKELFEKYKKHIDYIYNFNN